MLVYAIDAESDRVEVRLTVTTPACPLSETVVEEATARFRDSVGGAPAIDIQIVWEPQWTPDMMSSAAKSQLGWQ